VFNERQHELGPACILVASETTTRTNNMLGTRMRTHNDMLHDLIRLLRDDAGMKQLSADGFGCLSLGHGLVADGCASGNAARAPPAPVAAGAGAAGAAGVTPVGDGKPTPKPTPKPPKKPKTDCVDFAAGKRSAAGLGRVIMDCKEWTEKLKAAPSTATRDCILQDLAQKELELQGAKEQLEMTCVRKDNVLLKDHIAGCEAAKKAFEGVLQVAKTIIPKEPSAKAKGKKRTADQVALGDA
jgi:hypothetical protein